MTALAGSRVVVVGGGSGFGLATARGAAEAGAKVTVLSHTDASVAKAIGQLPSDVDGRAVSSLDEAKLRAMFDEIGPVDHLVYTAADAPVAGRITTMPVEEVRQAFETRYFGAVTTIRCAAGRVRQSITLTSGAASIRPRATSGVLAGVCGAMEALTRALAVELSPVRVNLVRPGFTNTGMWADLDEQAREALFRQTAETNLVGHVGEAAEVARAYLYCLTSTYATGSIVTVDGGYALT
ncbi:SDR family oxidoreductase [Amycolatopsis pithecellobii]|uniref:SDR family oxidoreductase n=1 Tax=Amycolatopsis pithecellobii TaxID=664692 RepID=A0A6N7Z0U0_9PSEU|nr:SDR family oxidoreductase [Amycolatopsis pithecellobii]MTD54329.1 SDR family oxidoreductase [Amycolatopsis pithecellobii]